MKSIGVKCINCCKRSVKLWRNFTILSFRWSFETFSNVNSNHNFTYLPTYLPTFYKILRGQKET